MSRLKLETSVEIPITLEEFMEYTSNQYRKTEGCQHVINRLDLQTLGSQPIMPKNLGLPDHCSKRSRVSGNGLQVKEAIILQSQITGCGECLAAVYQQF